MSIKKHNIVIEYVKESFLKFIEVTSNRYGSDYTFNMDVSKCVVNNYTDSYKIILECIYEKHDIQYSLFVIFYDEDDLSTLFEIDKRYNNIPDIVSIKLVEWSPSMSRRRFDNILHFNTPQSADWIILDETMNISTLLDKTNLADMMIEEYLFG